MLGERSIVREETLESTLDEREVEVGSLQIQRPQWVGLEHVVEEEHDRFERPTPLLEFCPKGNGYLGGSVREIWNDALNEADDSTAVTLLDRELSEDVVGHYPV